MNMALQVQILDEVVCILQSANIIGKSNNSSTDTSYELIIMKTGLFNLGMQA